MLEEISGKRLIIIFNKNTMNFYIILARKGYKCYHSVWLKLISKTNPIGLQRCTKSCFPIIIFHLVNLNLYEKPQKSILSFISVNLCSMACMVPCR